jgi:1,4-alpha-glucan branching enzyme
VRDGVDFRITMSLTPTLIAMLVDPLLQQRYVRHIEKLIELSEKEVRRNRHHPDFNRTALMYRDKFLSARHTFVDKYSMNLIRAFRGFQDIGKLEIITCGATHGFLPLMETVPKAARAQVAVAVEDYKRRFGRAPRGFWLPECGYYPGVDEYLKEAGIRYFFTDTHGLLYAVPRLQVWSCSLREGPGVLKAGLELRGRVPG